MEKPRIIITYCTRCRWLLRAAWIAQELLITFEMEIGEVVLRPDHSGGVFRIEAKNELVFSRTSTSGFPELKELKQKVRDIIAPEKPLGHSDVQNQKSD